MKTETISTQAQVAPELNRKDKVFRPQEEAVAPAPVFALKKILVPIDFSESSKKAAMYAVAMAKQFRARLAFVHVIVPFYAMDPYAILQECGLEDQLRQIAEDKLAALVRDEIPAGIASERLLCYGSPATEIVEAARKLNADLIIISTHGYTGLKHAMLGSTTENVVRHAPCPVLTVREKEHDFVSAASTTDDVDECDGNAEE